MRKLTLLGAALTVIMAASGTSAQDSCTDGAPGYAETLSEVGEELTVASESGSFSEMLHAADNGFETLVMMAPPSAYEEQHAYMLSALHNLALAGLAAGLGETTVADSYTDAAEERLEQFQSTFPEALAGCEA